MSSLVDFSEYDENIDRNKAISDHLKMRIIENIVIDDHIEVKILDKFVIVSMKDIIRIGKREITTESKYSISITKIYDEAINYKGIFSKKDNKSIDKLRLWIITDIYLQTL